MHWRVAKPLSTVPPPVAMSVTVGVREGWAVADRKQANARQTARAAEGRAGRRMAPDVDVSMARGGQVMRQTCNQNLAPPNQPCQCTSKLTCFIRATKCFLTTPL